jgi:hypothetical protein
MANDHGRTSQMSDNDAAELLPAPDGGDHRAEQAFRGQRTGQADQDPAAPGGRLGRARRIYRHLMPGCGTHRIGCVRPDSFGRLYAQMFSRESRP